MPTHECDKRTIIDQDWRTGIIHNYPTGEWFFAVLDEEYRIKHCPYCGERLTFESISKCPACYHLLSDHIDGTCITCIECAQG